MDQRALFEQLVADIYPFFNGDWARCPGWVLDEARDSAIDILSGRERRQREFTTEYTVEGVVQREIDAPLFERSRDRIESERLTHASESTPCPR